MPWTTPCGTVVLCLFAGNNEFADKETGAAEPAAAGHTEFNITADIAYILHECKEVARAGYLLDRANDAAVFNEQSLRNERKVTADSV